MYVGWEIIPGTGIKTKIWPTAIQQLGSLCSNNKNQEQVTTMKKIWPIGHPSWQNQVVGVGEGGVGGGLRGWEGEKERKEMAVRIIW